MQVGGLWRREEERGSGCLDPDASSISTALTAPLQCLTLSSAFSCSTLRRPLSLSQPPSSIGGDETLKDRGSLAAEGPDAYASVPENNIPSWSTTPPIRRRTVSNERRRRLRPRTTWHPSNGHWTWTSPALRTLRCAAFAEKEGRGSKRKVKTDATIELHCVHARIDRLKRRFEEIEGRRGGGAVSDATHHSQASEETSCVTVEEASPPQQTSHSRPCQLPAAQVPTYAVPSNTTLLTSKHASLKLSWPPVVTLSTLPLDPLVSAE